ncbi:hypothetical protein DEJ50_00010 [Streptomyces venezuelae]|uniref:WD40 repeat domain-containing protein n=1 Tax=Streptomyces venezuelae TaxID=54571 RepID=A0A5P2CW30_STRVZ|nr:hypothetical protein [Streptomyces venezuelae]QES46490.1 hypothetical protein DEJ50_00010 [Streptomyces venezuelae]
MRAATISPDGRWLAIARGTGTVSLHTIDTSTEIQTLTVHRRAVDALSVSPDGVWLATISADGTTRLWTL